MKAPCALQLFHYNFSQRTDEIVDILSLLDRIVPPATTWSQAEHDRQPHLSSKHSPGVAQHVSPECLQANFHGEFCFWLAEQGLSHESSRLILVAPESSALHQQSLWSLREFQTLEGCGGALRGANFLCQLSDRKIPQPLGFLTDLHFLHESLLAGWPSFNHTAKLSSYSGPLPVFCQCECQHVASALPVQEMGEKLWEHCLSAWLSEDVADTLREGKARSTQRSATRLKSYTTPEEVPLAPALSARQGALFFCLRQVAFRAAVETLPS